MLMNDHSQETPFSLSKKEKSLSEFDVMPTIKLVPLKPEVKILSDNQVSFSTKKRKDWGSVKLNYGTNPLLNLGLTFIFCKSLIQFFRTMVF